jgi:hypothetical protein
VPVPAGQRAGNGHPHDAMRPGASAFSGPRSPPNAKSRFLPRVFWELEQCLMRCRHVACAVQVLPPGRVPGGQGVSVSAQRGGAV